MAFGQCNGAGLVVVGWWSREIWLVGKFGLVLRCGGYRGAAGKGLVRVYRGAEGKGHVRDECWGLRLIGLDGETGRG